MISFLTAITLLAQLAVLAEAGPIERRATSTTVSASSTTSRAKADLQTYNLGLGAIYAPAVTKSGNFWYTNNQQFNFPNEALTRSCYTQMDQCQLKANQQNNTPFAVSDCNGWQVQDCLSGGSGSPASSSSTSTTSSSTSTAKTSSTSAAASSSSSATKSSSTAASSSSSATKSSTAAAISTTSSTASTAPKTSTTASSASSSSAAPTNTAAPTTVAAGNYQTFTGAAGGIVAPAVTKSGKTFVQSGFQYDVLYYALQQSCYAQASSCATSSASFDKSVCWNTQVNSCLNNAQTAADAYTSSLAVQSSSIASANFAAATQARTVKGDLQTFTGALGGAAAPAVTGTLHNWKVDGRWETFWNLYDALLASCYMQQDKATAAAIAVNWQYEMSGDNIYNVQISNCLENARDVADNWSPTTTPAATSTVNTAALASASAASIAAASSASAASVAAAASSLAAAAASASSAAIAAASSASVVAAASASSAAVAAASSAAAAAASSASAAASSASVVAAASSSSAAAAASSAAAAAASSASAAAAAASSAAAALLPPAGWSVPSTPCVAEGTRGRALAGPSLASGDMTWQKCADFCGGKGYSIFGIEYSTECYCGATLSNGASLDLPSTNCNMKCGGSGAICGGGNALTIFVKDTLRSSGSLTSDLTAVKVALPGAWVPATSTCVQEGTSGRALAGAAWADDKMTIGKCLAFCQTKGMQWAGIEYGRECYCGNDLVNGASLKRTGSCDMNCGGQIGTICGGQNLLSLYKDESLLYSLTQIGNWAKQGCIQEVAGRALTGAALVKDDMTLETCTSFCSKKGYAFAGLEYGTECYCGNTLDNGASFDAFSTQCNMPCGGKSQQTCGGPNGISLWSTRANALIGA